MADGAPPLELRSVSAIAEIDADLWDGLAAAAEDAAAPNPFVRHAFLSAVEASKSVGEATGWMPRHLVLSRGEETVGVAPVYLKMHSRGEYVFDQHWADAYARAGGRYYPKLLTAAPFTPAAGPRFLAASAEDRARLAGAMRQAAAEWGVSSLHVNFVTDEDAAAGETAGYMIREGAQYHWFNRGYETFDDFLAALASRKRKTIRRERRQAAESGLVIKRLRGAEITETHWDAFWLFYQDTGARKWGTPYLTRTFFRLAAESMGEQLLLIVAERDGAPIAGALNVIGEDALYGRYWGCLEHHPFLHFELCYHQAIEFAIENRLSRVEAGAQGEHKIARGYEPATTRSLHWIADPGFREAIARYLAEERAQNAAEIDHLSDFTPFRKGGGQAC